MNPGIGSPWGLYEVDWVMDCGTCSPGSWIFVGIVEHLKAFLLRSTEFSHSAYPAEEFAHKVLVKRERQERVRQTECGKIFHSLLLIQCLCECKPVGCRSALICRLCGWFWQQRAHILKQERMLVFEGLWLD